MRPNVDITKFTISFPRETHKLFAIAMPPA